MTSTQPTGVEPMSDVQKHQLFLQILSLMTYAPFYRRLSIDAIERRVMLALDHRCQMYFSDDKTLLGYVSWLNLDATQEQDFLRDPLQLSHFAFIV